jgi:hypothetical protein
MLQKAIIACCAILVIVIVLSIAKKRQENYVIYDDTKLASINVCGRNLAFPYFRNANILASERAITDTDITTYPAGKCISGRNSACNVSEGYAILYENDIFYVLKKACLRLNLSSATIQGNTLSAVIKMQQDDDIKNICTFLTLNPLWVEFHTDKRTTLAYRAVSYRPFTTDMTTYSLKFVPVQPYSSTRDSLFNYKSYDANKQTPLVLQHRELSATEVSDRLNMSVYYLDRMDVAFQSISTVMNLTYDEKNGTTVIYDPQYKEKDSCASQQEFMQNISLMLQNMYTPVLTFQWQIGVTSLSSNRVIIKAYMDNTVGTYKSCGSYNDFDVQKNNIFSGALKTHDKSSFILDLFTGSSKGKSCFFPETAISLHLPYLPETQMINVIYTMTPHECVAYAEWMNTTAGEFSKSMTFSKRQSCSSRQHSALYDLFKARKTVGLAPIYLKYDTSIVKKLFTCTQGFVNIYRTFANFT